MPTNGLRPIKSHATAFAKICWATSTRFAWVAGASDFVISVRARPTTIGWGFASHDLQSSARSWVTADNGAAAPKYARRLAPEIEALAEASRRLRRDRELAFYGAEDLTPSGFYSRRDAKEAKAWAERMVALIAPHVPRVSGP